MVVPTGCVIASVPPREDDNVTVAPETGLFPASRTVTVTVLVDVPSAVTLDGAAEIVVVSAEGPPVAKVTAAVCVTFTEPFTTALITALPVVDDATVPVIWPAPFVVPTGWVNVSVAPREDDNVTVDPETGLLLTSRTVTVIVEVADPSATTVDGAALTVEVDPEGEPVVNVTVAVCVTFTEPLTAALITALPAVVDVTVPVIWPDAFVVPTGCVIVSVTPRDDDRVTVAPGTGLLFASRTVTVIVLAVVPSAKTVPGAAVTVETAAEGVPAVNVTAAVCVTLIVPLTTALMTPFPAVVDRTVPVI